MKMFTDLITDSYRLRKEYSRLSGIMYGAISSVGFSEVTDIEEYANTCNIDMLHLQNGNANEEIDIYKSELENYKVDRELKRIFIKIKGRLEQSISFN